MPRKKDVSEATHQSRLAQMRLWLAIEASCRARGDADRGDHAHSEAERLLLSMEDWKA